MSPSLYQEEKGDPKPLETLIQGEGSDLNLRHKQPCFSCCCPHDWPSPHPFFFFFFSEYEDGISAWILSHLLESYFFFFLGFLACPHTQGTPGNSLACVFLTNPFLCPQGPCWDFRRLKVKGFLPLHRGDRFSFAIAGCEVQRTGLARKLQNESFSGRWGLHTWVQASSTAEATK